MEVIYRRRNSVKDSIDKELGRAAALGKDVSRIILTQREWKEFRDDLDDAGELTLEELIAMKEPRKGSCYIYRDILVVVEE